MSEQNKAAVRKLIRECRECAGDRLTPGTPSVLLNAAADSLEGFLVEIKDAKETPDVD